MRDSAALLDATSGPAPGDPYPAPERVRPFLDEVGADPGVLRIGFSRTSAEATPLHPDSAEALEVTLRLLESLGHVLVEASFPEFDERTGNAINTFMSSSAAWILAYWQRRLGHAPGPGELNEWTATLIDGAKNISAADFLLARDDINAFSRHVAADFEDYDLFLSPTVTTPPPTLAAIKENPGDMIRNAGIIANLTGNPAMSVPLFWNAAGLPIGSHFLARYGDEVTLFRLAAQLEVAQPWADRWPPLR